ncbi:serine/threonine protein kinase [Paraburkholderia sp.]|uniref:serine/threonine protein kinase n=1 Tax=Paraburkholderia sp. TaxID=1926495 RepID=UPI0023A24A55|nr:serine/threonine protein kinase [Paraburkholderia sp.]MDE1184298.1 protein kinase [Paraburkholderia sp.]
MASLAHVIRDYQSGGLSRDEFVAQVDSTLTTEGPGPARLLDILGEAHARMPLPSDLYAEVRRRIEQLPAAQRVTSAEETRLQTRPDYAFPPSASDPSGGPTPTPAPGHDQVKGTGDTLNHRFVLEECLGVGGMGSVYKALDLRKVEASDRKPYLAIKVLNVQFRGNPKSLIALQREARKAQVLAHRNIVTVYDFDRDGVIVYLTMEYLTGKPLSQFMRSKDFHGMPVRAALPIIRGMCGALAYAHERGFVHCDFKPANVFLTDGGEVKVIDFGIARVFQRPEEESDATVFDPGSLGALTPAYASPEMLEHREPDPRDDIYALGCITYELLTGRHPFDRQSAIQARSAGRKPERPENIGTRQWRALRASLSFDRDARTPTVNRFMEEFGADERSAKRTAPHVPPNVRALGLAALAGVAVASIGVYLFRSSSGSHEAAPTAPMAFSASAASSASLEGNGRSSGSAVKPAIRRDNASAEPAPSGKGVDASVTMAAVAPLLAQAPCSALSASVRDHALQVNGFVSQRYGAARLKDALSLAPGVDTLNVDVTPLSDDKCNTIKSLAPFWTHNWQSGHAASLRVRPATGLLTEGDPLIVDVSTPPYNSYVNIDYYELDGSVVHMVPGPRAKDNQAPPRYSATIGGGGDWIISKPFGSELVVLLVTPVPLFDSLRPESESRADYLRALDTRLSQIAGKYGRDKILADIAPITTRARGN